MHTRKALILAVLALLSFSGCVDYLEETADPCFEMFTKNGAGELTATTAADVEEEVTFEACSPEATDYAIWTGDEGHQYSQREAGDFGDAADGNEGIYEYAYLEAGTYEVTWIATIKYLDRVDRATSSKTITINE